MGVREGRLDEGIDYAARAVALAPDDAEARYWYGRALLRADRVAERLGHLEPLERIGKVERDDQAVIGFLEHRYESALRAFWFASLLAFSMSLRSFS